MTPAELKEARRKLGLSTNKLGEAMGVDARTIRRWEAGDRSIPGPVQVAVAYMLKFGLLKETTD